MNPSKPCKGWPYHPQNGTLGFDPLPFAQKKVPKDDLLIEFSRVARVNGWPKLAASKDEQDADRGQEKGVFNTCLEGQK